MSPEFRAVERVHEDCERCCECGKRWDGYASSEDPDTGEVEYICEPCDDILAPEE